jgi:MFS family permease
VIIVIGALVNGLANSEGMFIGGRIILGFGGGITKVCAPALLNEIAHPRLRPILACIYYPFYFFGSTISAWLCCKSSSLLAPVTGADT